MSDFRDIPNRWSSNAWLLGVAAVAVLYMGMLWQLNGMPFTDLPNHAARAEILRDLIVDHGARFGADFTFEWQFAPYILGDLLYAGMIHLVGLDAATRLWVLLAFISWPLACAYYLRCAGYSTTATLTGVLLSLFLATDLFFLSGFFNFRTGLAIAMLALALAVRLCERLTTGRLIAYAAAVLCAYLMHLAAIVMLAVAVGTMAGLRLLRGRISLRTAIVLCAPIGLLMLWQLFGAPQADAVSHFTHWHSIADKLLRTVTPYIRMDAAFDVMLLLPVVALIGWAAWYALRQRMLGAAWEPLAIACALLITHMLLPTENPQAYDIDARALPLAWAFGLFAALRILDIPVTQSKRWAPPLLLVAASVIAVANLGLLWGKLAGHNASLLAYREVVAQVPSHARVLSIATRPDDGRVQPYLHAGCWAIAQRAALLSTLFSATNGHAMTYFRYRQRPYTPDSFWYLRSGDAALDWERIAAAYDYLLITKPVDRTRLHVATSVVAQNDDALLLRIVKVADSTPQE